MSENKEKPHLSTSQREPVIKVIGKKTEIKDSCKTGEPFLQ